MEREERLKNFGTHEHSVCHLLSVEPITAVMLEQEEKRQTFLFYLGVPVSTVIWPRTNPTGKADNASCKSEESGCSWHTVVEGGN